MDKNFLPSEFEYRHNYCVFLYDTLVVTLREAESSGVFAVPYRPKTLEEGRELLRLEGEEVWEWFESRGHDEVVSQMVLNRVVPAIIADLCLFVHEALSCSRRCKLTVAYALLRKPLRENLLYLEWILIDAAEFVKEFRSGTPRSISMGALSPEYKRRLVERAVKLTRTTSAYPEDFIHDIRYSKDKNYGFEILWNQAVHW